MPPENWQMALKSVVEATIDLDYVDNVRSRWSSLKGAGPEVIASTLYEIANYQGMSDRAASSWLVTNGNPDFLELADRLTREQCACAASAAGINNCGYLRSQNVCSHPALLSLCIVPTIPARKGQLARLAVALSYWAAALPDQCLVAWARSKLKRGDPRSGAAAMVEDLKSLPGVSDKVASMIASDIAIGLSARRPALFASGASVVVVDSLVHNLLLRSGAILAEGKPHTFGSACYATDGCRDLIVRFSETIDARRYNSAWPQTAPRMLQHALWRFCAGNEFNVCNGNQIHAGTKCKTSICPARRRCARLIIEPK